jgi:two-component system CheB/CheR fusion protein
LRGTDIAPAADQERFGDILAILHEATGIDFSLYREKTIKRRIPRRLALRNIDNLVEYAKRRHDSE